MGKARFVTPFFMFIVGTFVALQLIATITANVGPTQLFNGTMINDEPLSPTLGTDIAGIMIIALPILFLEYVLLAVPVAVVILLITKIVKSNRYNMNIMNIGREFGGTQIMRRAAAPALFSVASANLFSGLIRNVLFGPSFDPLTLGTEIAPLFNAGLSLMGALLFVPIALLLFMPTWVLNDAGVVTHLKSDNLTIRHCPDTQGVGRWIANMLGGFALLAFPITMFMTQFYTPIIEPILTGAQLTIPEIFYQGILALLWTIGLPFFVMAYIIPLVMFNEAMQTRSTVRILRLARRLGAKLVHKEKIQEIKRLSYAYDEEQKGTVELYAAAGNKEIVMTQKSIKSKNKTKTKGNKDSKKNKTSKKETKKRPKKK
ncbi:MAG: hypothetical protein ACTSWA_01170 [Candidatus Thorarchaeota archaeon]